MHEGRITWATGGLHPRRRWRRQLGLATGRKAAFPKAGDGADACWDYWELQHLANSVLSPNQVSAIVRGVLLEIFFDIVQAFELPLASNILRSHQPLLPLSKLVGIGDGLQVTPVAQGILTARCLPSIWTPSAPLMQQDTQAAWEQWVCMGLLDALPDSAPVVGDRLRLRERTSAKAFQNLVVLLDGKRTLRDIALKLKHGRNQLGVGRALAPYIRQGIVVFRSVGDIVDREVGRIDRSAAPTPIAVCIESIYGQCGTAIESIATRAGYAYHAMSDGIEALHELLRPSAPTPTLILIAEELTILSAPEVCRIVRRVDRLREVPIVVYSQRRCDPRQIQEALRAGASNYLCGPDFCEERLQATFDGCRDGNSSGSMAADSVVSSEKATYPPSRARLPEVTLRRQSKSSLSRIVLAEGTVSSRSTLLTDGNNDAL